MKINRRIKLISFITALVILVISGISAWRLLAIFQAQPLGWATYLVVWLSLTLGFILFWMMVWFIVTRYFNRIMTRQKLLTAIIGAIVFIFLGLLITTPAGLSRITLELYADNVWSPNIFTVSWGSSENTLTWHRPLNLPVKKPVPVTLEITTTGHHLLATSSQVWLLKAFWPDGSIIPLDEFQVDNGWKQQEINWATYQNQPVLVSRQNQPAVLRWQGVATGPLTLLFAKHNQAGEITIRWNDIAQTIDLYAPNVEFKGVTLPTNETIVWRANLPMSALAKEMGILVEPDPGGNYPAVIQKIAISGIPGQTWEATDDNLLNAIQVKSGQIALTSAGLQFSSDKSDESPAGLFLETPLAINSVRWSSIIAWLENTLVVVYLAVVGGVISGSVANMLKPSLLSNLNIAVISLIIALVIGEIGLQIYLPPPDKYYVWQPNLRTIFKPLPGLAPGIEGEAHLIINSQGLRGDEFSPEDDYRILTIGGSTTECLLLDQTEAWPQVLQDMLNENDKGWKVWVGNAGRSGHNTRAHIVQMQHLLLQYPSIDAVIVLMGINDFGLRLNQEDSYTPTYLTSPDIEQEYLKKAFYLIVKQDPDLPYYQRSATWRLLERTLQSRSQQEAAKDFEIQDSVGESLIKSRELRKNAVIRNELPDLSASLDEYTRNVNKLIDIAEMHGLRLILMTQPTLWHSGLTQKEKDLLWSGRGPNGQYYYSLEALIEGMSIYNERLLKICRQRQVECIDLANAIPKDTTVFYDDVHFNESGAAQVARVVADYMSHHALFILNAH